MGQYLETKINTSAERTVQKLKASCQSLGEQLLRVAKELDEKGIKASINTVGEIQSQGNQIDRLCGEFGIVRDLIEIIEAENIIQNEKNNEGKPNEN